MTGPVRTTQCRGNLSKTIIMSQWRREASIRLPELQNIIASKDIDSPMMLWIELNQEFERRCADETPPLDLLRRIWQYSDWCLHHRNDDVQTASALGFCEHLIDTPARIRLLPQIIKKSDFLKLQKLLEYHNSPADVASCLNSLWN